MSYKVNYHPAKACGNCKYFNRYYTNLTKDIYLPTSHGRCDYPDKKDTEEDYVACKYWQNTTEVEETL